MIFRIYEDGMGGYFGYWTTPGMDAVSGILAGPMLVLAILIGPLFCVMMFGAQLLLPTAIILLGLLMLYTPGSKNIRQNTLLVCTKMALSVPLFFYGVTCIAYTIGVGGNTITGTSGLLTLLAILVGFVPILAIVVLTKGLAAPMLLLWPGSYIAASNGGFPTATNFILHAAYLEGIGIFIYGIVKVIKSRDKNGIYILPKLIAFGLGCIPLIALTVLSGLSYWIIIVLAVVLYLGVYFLYNFKLKQPSLFADWLMYPFLGSLGCYLIVNSYSEYIFPSEIIDSLCDILTPIQVLFEPSYKICFAFAEAISDLFYGIMKLLFKVLPDVGAYAIHVNVPWIIGGVAGVALIAVICNITGKQHQKRANVRT